MRRWLSYFIFDRAIGHRHDETLDLGCENSEGDKGTPGYRPCTYEDAMETLRVFHASHGQRRNWPLSTGCPICDRDEACERLSRLRSALKPIPEKLQSFDNAEPLEVAKVIEQELDALRGPR